MTNRQAIISFEGLMPVVIIEALRPYVDPRVIKYAHRVGLRDLGRETKGVWTGEEIVMNERYMLTIGSESFIQTLVEELVHAEQWLRPAFPRLNGVPILGNLSLPYVRYGAVLGISWLKSWKYRVDVWSPKVNAWEKEAQDRRNSIVWTKYNNNLLEESWVA